LSFIHFFEAWHLFIHLFTALAAHVSTRLFGKQRKGQNFAEYLRASPNARVA